MTHEELMAVIGVGQFLRAKGVRMNLRYADLRYADLRGAYLRDADLRYADLRGADLRDADLRYADLRGADLSGATGMPWHCYGGSAHTGWMPTPTEIQIGCERDTITYWLAHYAEIGAKHGYTPEQVEEYGAWIKSVAERAPVAQEGEK